MTSSEPLMGTTTNTTSSSPSLASPRVNSATDSLIVKGVEIVRVSVTGVGIGYGYYGSYRHVRQITCVDNHIPQLCTSLWHMHAHVCKILCMYMFFSWAHTVIQ